MSESNAPVGPSMVPPSNALPAGAAPAYIAGVDSKPTDQRVVAVTIGVRANFKCGDRDFSGSIPLHEVAIARKFYELLGGSLTVEPGWVPLLSRHRQLTRDNLIQAVERMRATYRIPKQNGVIEVMHEFFGNEPSQQVVRVHALMRDQFAAWKKTVAVAKEALKIRLRGDAALRQQPPYVIEAATYDHITPQDLEALVKIGQPDLQGVPDLEGIELPTVPTVENAPSVDLDALQAQASDAADREEDPALKIVEKGVKAGLTERQALEVASLVALADSPVSISDDDLVKVLGSKAKIAIARSVIGA